MCRKLRLPLSSIIIVVPVVGIFLRKTSEGILLFKRSRKKLPTYTIYVFIGTKDVWSRQTHYITPDDRKFGRDVIALIIK